MTLQPLFEHRSPTCWCEWALKLLVTNIADCHDIIIKDKLAGDGFARSHLKIWFNFTQVQQTVFSFSSYASKTSI